MTDRIAGEGADDFAIATPDTAVSGLGYAGWVQGKIADNVAAGLTNPITRATAAGKLQYLASLVSGGDTTPGGALNVLLIESGDGMLLETGDYIPVTDSFAGLAEAITMTSADTLYIVQGGVSKRVSIATITGFI